MDKRGYPRRLLAPIDMANAIHASLKVNIAA
jgi:hypothetical protein